jgi:hypothetical protein
MASRLWKNGHWTAIMVRYPEVGRKSPFVIQLEMVSAIKEIDFYNYALVDRLVWR